MAITAETLIPAIGMELNQPHPNYISRVVFEPCFVWDPSKQPGESVRLDRYGYFGDRGDLSQDSRRRQQDQLIGANNSRNLNKTEIYIPVDEFTGPSGGDINDPNKPGNIRLSYKNIRLTQQRMLWDPNAFNDLSRRQQFHQSIGSAALLDDYKRCIDRWYIDEALKIPTKYNPLDIPSGGTYTTGPTKFSVVQDLETIIERLQIANAPQFDDGLYRAIVHPTFLKHLRQDKDFREVMRYPGAASIASMQDPINPYAPLRLPHPNSVDVMSNPNMALLYGMLTGQSATGGSHYDMNSMFPTGFVFGGVRWFVSNNLPTSLVPLNYTALTPGANPAKHPTGLAQREAFPGIFFGKDLIGEVLATNEPVSCLVNNNSDYDRFLIVVWQCFGGYKLINPTHGIVAYSYGD